MEKHILLIDEKETFISRALIDNLRANKFEVDFCQSQMREVSKLEKIPDLVFLNVEENFMQEHADLFVYLKDVCVEGDKLLFVAGYSGDIQEVVKALPESIIGGTFERPINTKSVAEFIYNKIENGGETLGRRHILIVDDSGEFLRAIKGWLSGQYAVSMVNSAANAISFLATNKPDLILLDYEMPICNGPQLLEMIRAEIKTADIPVIFLTSKDDKESVKKVLALHPQGYLLKTLTPDKIVSSVNEFFQLNKGK